MAVYYKLQENQIKNSKSQGKWFAHATPLGTKGIEDMAKIIQRNCSMKRSDVLAVLSEFSEVMADFLQDGYRIKIDKLGSFKVGVSSRGADSPSAFKGENDIRKARINFAPAKVWNRNAKKYTAEALDGVSFAPIASVTSEIEMTRRFEDGKSGGSQTGGSTSGGGSTGGSGLDA